MTEKLVYDLGFHKGEDTPYYLSKGFKVVAVEANPVLVQQNTRRLRKFIDSGQLTLLNIGIANERGNLPFWVNHKHTEWSSFVKQSGCRFNTGCHSVNVDCLPLTDLFDKYGVPYYLKIDIEGHDVYCLEQISADNKPMFVSCESSNDLLELLRKKGYSKFKLINNYDGFHPLNVDRERNLLRAEMLYIRWYFFKAFPFLTKFPMGASGPLPEETQGNWISYEQALDTYNKWNGFIANENNRGLVKNLSWIDIHAA